MDLTELNPDAVAEAIESSRIALLNQGPWSQLRESERAVRLDVLTRAMAAGGVTDALARLRARAEAVDDLSARLAEVRDAAARERVEADRQIARLNERIIELEREVDRAERQHAAAQGHVDELEAAMQGADRPAGAPWPGDGPQRRLLGRMRTAGRR